MYRFAVGVIATLAATSALAQSAPAVAPEKQALVQRVLARMPMENVALQMLQAPVNESMRQARALLQGRVAQEKQDAVLKEIAADANKFLDDEAPLVRASAKEVVASTIAPMLAQRFTDDELKQLAAILESPVKAKFEALVPEIQKTLGENVARASQAQVNPRLTELQNKIGLRLRAAVAQ